MMNNMAARYIQVPAEAERANADADKPGSSEGLSSASSPRTLYVSKEGFLNN
jgi:hypothetical protein